MVSGCFALLKERTGWRGIQTDNGPTDWQHSQVQP